MWKPKENVSHLLVSLVASPISIQLPRISERETWIALEKNIPKETLLWDAGKRCVLSRLR